jgi:hypothetical protein
MIKLPLNEQGYSPIFDIMMDCLSNGNQQDREDLEKYILHRHKFGRQAAARIYPRCHNIIIEDQLLKESWEKLLKTIDKL